jgi:hypothetical protein
VHKHDLGTLLRQVSRGDAEKRLVAIAQTLFESINTPKALAASILLQNREYSQLVSLDADPNSYLTATAFADDYQVVKFLSKFPSFKHPDLDPEKAGRDSFYQFELQCRKTNKRFRELAEDPQKWDPEMRGILLLARRKIAEVLGDVDLSAISDKFGWGPGATSVSRGHYTSAYIKFAQRLDVTSNALIMGHCCVNSTPSWVNCQLQTDSFPSVAASITREAFNIVRGNEVVFVPKNAKTYRVIAKEPHVNSYLQKGFGAQIRQRLRDVAGVNLNDQTRNQRLARHGSLTGELATIDLSGASDTISSELVKFLLPSRWFKLLDAVRSKQGYLDGNWIHYEKFSSMGNAYTFELESLIFWALCKSALHVHNRGQTLSVYGDDLIVPSSAYSLVVKVLEFSGFTTNDKKSFSSGPFRESCGQDYFLGTSVRPIFLKEDVAHVESLYRLANSIRRYAHRRDFYHGCDCRFENAWKQVVSYIPGKARIKIPDGFGDVGLVANFDEAVPSRARNGWEGYRFKALIRLPLKEAMRDKTAGYTAVLSAIGAELDESDLEILNERVPKGFVLTKSDVLRVDRLQSLYSSAPSQGFHNLRDMTRPKVALVHTCGWYDFGPWQ